MGKRGAWLGACVRGAGDRLKLLVRDAHRPNHARLVDTVRPGESRSAHDPLRLASGASDLDRSAQTRQARVDRPPAAAVSRFVICETMPRPQPPNEDYQAQEEGPEPFLRMVWGFRRAWW
jgi:hypothetical protein